jgi:hypothetical protein
MTNGTSPGRAMIVLGGVGGILWLVGAILSVVQHYIVSGVGGIILGIGVLFASFAGIGFWQRTKDMMAILMFVFAMVGGILLLVGGVLSTGGVLSISIWGVGCANNYVFMVGQMLFAISLIMLGLVINKLGPQLNTQARLGIDLVFPAVATTIWSFALVN